MGRMLRKIKVKRPNSRESIIFVKLFFKFKVRS